MYGGMGVWEVGRRLEDRGWMIEHRKAYRIEIFLSGDGGKPYAQMGRRPISPEDYMFYPISVNVILARKARC